MKRNKFKMEVVKKLNQNQILSWEIYKYQVKITQ